MKKIIVLILALSLAFVLKAQDTTLCLQRAAIVWEGLQKDDMEPQRAFYTEQMIKSLPPNALDGVIKKLEVAGGPFQEAGPFHVTPFDTYTQITSSLRFENKTFQLKLTFDLDNKLAGIFFVPLRTNPSATLEENEQFKETSITVSSVIDLPGILTMPKGKENVPIVILVHGSGKVDRNETIGPNAVFKDIAHGLAKQGIASIRYDKRTYMEKGYDPENWTVWDGTVNDALVAARLARTLEGVDGKKVFIVGHSLGANQTPRILEQDAELAGGVILAGNARQLQKLIWEQHKYLFGFDGINAEEKAHLKVLKKQIKRANKSHCDCKDYDLKDLPLGYPQAFYSDMNRYFPTETAAKLKQPLFIVQGERDYQVTMKEYEIWKKKLRKKENATLKSYPKLNHLLIEGEGLSKPEEYSKKGNVSEELLSDMAEWILQQSK